MAHSKMILNEKAVRVPDARPDVARTSDDVQTKIGLEFRRWYTDGKTAPFDKVEWEKRTAQIGNEKGQVIFSQENVEVPKSWSQTATNIVSSKYFH